MKQIILSIVTFSAIVAFAQTDVPRPPALYEAANWKTKLLDNPLQITIAAPPGAAQSNVELQSIKELISLMKKNWQK